MNVAFEQTVFLQLSYLQNEEFGSKVNKSTFRIFQKTFYIVLAVFLAIVT